MIVKLLIPFLFLSIELFSQNLDSLQTQITRVEEILLNKKQILFNEQSKHQPYLISGEIREIDEYYLMIYGSAIPTNNDYSSPGTVVNNYFHLFVKPSKQNITYNYYQGTHYYLFKDKQGYNIFGDLPQKDKEIITNIKNEISQLGSKFELLKQNYNATLSDILIKQAKEKLNENNFEESISLLLKTKQLFPTNKEINQLLLKNYIELAQKDSSTNNYIASLSIIKTAIQLENLSNLQYEQLNEFHSHLCSIIADSYFKKENYPEAITYYSQSLKDNGDYISYIKGRYAESYFQIANDNLRRNNVEQAKSNYKKSFEIDNNLLPKIKNDLESQQKSSFLLGLSSIIPGLGQILQGDSKSGLTQFGIFSGSIVGGLILKSVADNGYKDYKKATQEDNAVRLYDESNKKLNYSYALFGLGCAVMIYSIIDSFIKSENYNKKYEINFESSSSVSYENITFLLKFYF